MSEKDSKKASLTNYRHTQIGYIIIAALVLVLLLITVVMALSVFSWIAFAGVCVLVICLLSFSFLTVMIQDNTLNVRFGPGIISKKFYLKDIQSCQVVKNRWFYGWGIHLTPHGWLYNVSGLSAVEIRLRSGKTYRIGTDVPSELEQAIRKNINASVAGTTNARSK